MCRAHALLRSLKTHCPGATPHCPPPRAFLPQDHQSPLTCQMSASGSSTLSLNFTSTWFWLSALTCAVHAARFTGVRAEHGRHNHRRCIAETVPRLSVAFNLAAARLPFSVPAHADCAFDGPDPLTVDRPWPRLPVLARGFWW